MKDQFSYSCADSDLITTGSNWVRESSKLHTTVSVCSFLEPVSKQDNHLSVDQEVSECLCYFNSLLLAMVFQACCTF